MIKLKPFLVVLAVLLLLSVYFSIGIFFPTIMFFVSLGMIVVVLCISVYKVAERHFSQFEFEDEIENK